LEKLLERERAQERGRCEMERGSSRGNERWVRDGTLANLISLYFSFFLFPLFFGVLHSPLL